MPVGPGRKDCAPCNLSGEQRAGILPSWGGFMSERHGLRGCCDGHRTRLAYEGFRERTGLAVMRGS